MRPSLRLSWLIRPLCCRTVLCALTLPVSEPLEYASGVCFSDESHKMRLLMLKQHFAQEWKAS